MSTERERDDSAVKVAEALWPQRYMGDLSRAEWERCYAVVDAANEQLRALRAERDRLAEALRPFVEAYERTGWEFCPEFNGPKDLAMFDRARAAGEEER